MLIRGMVDESDPLSIWLHGWIHFLLVFVVRSGWLRTTAIGSGYDIL